MGHEFKCVTPQILAIGFAMPQRTMIALLQKSQFITYFFNSMNTPVRFYQ